MVEALKARNVIYRVMLRYFLWMARLSAKAQWAVVIGMYVGTRLLARRCRRQTGLEAGDLRASRRLHGVRMLHLAADRCSIFCCDSADSGAWPFPATSGMRPRGGLMLAGALASLVAWIAGIGPPALLAAFFFAFLAPPIAIVYRCPPGWPAAGAGLYAGGMAAVAGAAFAGISET